MHLLCQTLKSLKVRVSVIGLSAEVRVCTVLTRETGGLYHVILDESHFKELLMLHVKPPPASSSSECSLIRMGQYIDAVSKLPATMRCIGGNRNQVMKTATERQCGNSATIFSQLSESSSILNNYPTECITTITKNHDVTHAEMFTNDVTI